MSTPEPSAATFEWVDLPVGLQPLPAWAKGMEVSWYDGYTNGPRLSVIADLDDPRRWLGQVWDYHPGAEPHRMGMYCAQHDDGRAVAYWHGPLAFGRGSFWSSADRRWRETMQWATAPSEGLGGSAIAVTMRDGREALLRGPWCSSGPQYHQEIVFHRATDRVGIPAFLRDDVVIALFARFLPHLRLARVTYPWAVRNLFWTRLEPVKPEWDAPKEWALAQRRFS